MKRKLEGYLRVLDGASPGRTGRPQSRLFDWQANGVAFALLQVSPFSTYTCALITLLLSDARSVYRFKYCITCTFKRQIADTRHATNQYADCVLIYYNPKAKFLLAILRTCASTTLRKLSLHYSYSSTPFLTNWVPSGRPRRTLFITQR